MFIETHEGIAFNVTNPSIEDVSIEDIAHALSNLCRFNGHTNMFYSVAQHSLNCMKVAELIGADVDTQLNCLMHDAAEAYICDVPKPIKSLLNGYDALENRVAGCIYDALSIRASHNLRTVKAIDTLVMSVEAIRLMRCKVWDPTYSGITAADYEFIKDRLDFFLEEPYAVKQRFLDTYEDLQRRRTIRLW